MLAVVALAAAAGKRVAVPHDFPSIRAALGECDAGDTVVVSRGIYRENIVLADNVVLQGEAMLTTVIDGGRKGPCITGADGAVVRNLTIRNGTVGILCRNSRPIIERNLIIDNKGAGIHAVLVLPEITNNVICHNTWAGIFMEDVRSTGASANHNVIAGNGYCGVFCRGRTEAVVHNNIVTGNREYGIFVGAGAAKTRIANNDFFGNRVVCNGKAVVPPSNLRKDPGFLRSGPPGFDYSLEPSSPCRGAGDDGKDIGLLSRPAAVTVGDRDGDGTPDQIDQCPDLPEDKDGFEDEDGCPDPDNDRDGIIDLQDHCPNLAGDRDGCPVFDGDRDGIPDSVDRFLNRPAAYTTAGLGNGCNGPAGRCGGPAESAVKNRAQKKSK